MEVCPARARRGDGGLFRRSQVLAGGPDDLEISRSGDRHEPFADRVDQAGPVDNGEASRLIPPNSVTSLSRCSEEAQARVASADKAERQADPPPGGASIKPRPSRSRSRLPRWAEPNTLIWMTGRNSMCRFPQALKMARS